MKSRNILIAFVLAFVCIFSACSDLDESEYFHEGYESVSTNDLKTEQNQPLKSDENIDYEVRDKTFNLSGIPSYSGNPYTAVNNNVPYFTKSEYTTESFEKYSDLDSLGRCGVAYANICVDIMPTEERGNIGSVKPSGWHTVKYDNVDGKYLYNRCHLIGFQLSGENSNEKNLITGTRYMNVSGMLPFENMVADYVSETKNHVLYRVTPVFEDSNLLATGVLMEALSVEDNGEGICFNVFCYNEQPGIVIDRKTGDSKLADTEKTPKEKVTKESSNTKVSSYIANKNTKKFHLPSCTSVSKMKEKNREYLNCTREQAISEGYVPCGNCKP